MYALTDPYKLYTLNLVTYSSLNLNSSGPMLLVWLLLILALILNRALCTHLLTKNCFRLRSSSYAMNIIVGRVAARYSEEGVTLHIASTPRCPEVVDLGLPVTLPRLPVQSHPPCSLFSDFHKEATAVDLVNKRALQDHWSPTSPKIPFKQIFLSVTFSIQNYL